MKLMKRITTNLALGMALLGLAFVPAKALAGAIDLQAKGASYTATVAPSDALAEAKLYLVWGDRDYGNNPSEWPHPPVVLAETIGADGGTFSQTVTGIPAGSVVKALAGTTSQVDLLNGYVAMTAAQQYVDSGIPVKQVYGVDIDFQITGHSTSYASLISSACDQFTFGGYAGDDKLYLRYRNRHISDSAGDSIPLSVGARNEISLHSTGIWLNGSLCKEIPEDIRDKSVGGDDANIFIGTCAQRDRFMYANWYYVRFYDENGEQSANFIPAKSGSVYGLYESVSKRFCPNDGTGGAFSGDGTVTNQVSVFNFIDLAHAVYLVPGGVTLSYRATVPRDVYFDTGFAPNQDTRTVMDVTVQSTTEYWFGMWDNGFNDHAYAVGNDGGNVYTGYGNNGGGTVAPLSQGRKLIDFDHGKLIVDGGSPLHTRTLNTFQNVHSIYFFAQNRIGNPTYRDGQKTIVFHSCQIYDNGALVRDYVPCRALDGTVQLFNRMDGLTHPFSGSKAVLLSTLVPYGERGAAIDATAGDVTLTAEDIQDFAELSEVVKLGAGTAWFTGAEAYECAALTVQDGAIGFDKNDKDEFPSLTVGKLTLNGDLEIRLPEFLKAGTIDLLTAGEVVGGNIVLAEECKEGSGTTTRTLVKGVDGKFSVVIEGDPTGIPEDYEELPYIESDGTQYIDTEYIHKANTKVEAVVKVWRTTQVNGWAAIFGARKNSGDNNAFVFFSKSYNNNDSACYNRSGNQAQVFGFVYDEKATLTCEGTSASWTSASGKSGSGTSTGTADDGVNNMFIFNLNTAGEGELKADTSGCCLRLYSFKIWEGEALLHDYAPVRSAKGQLGLFDKMTGAFLTKAAGNDFTTAELPAANLKYLRSTGEQYIDLDYVHKASTRIEADVLVPSEQAKNRTDWHALFGARKGDWKSNAFIFFVKGGGGNTIYNRSGGQTSIDSIAFDERLTLVCDGVDARWTTVGGVTGSGKSEGSADDGANSMFLFDLNRAGAGGFDPDGSTSCATLYSFQISDNEGTSRTLVPYREEDTHGLKDMATGRMFANAKTVPFEYGLAYRADAENKAIELYDGDDFKAADIEGYTQIAKKSASTLNAAKVATLPSLAVEDGVWSLEDGAAATQTVTGDLTLAGGATLAFDLTADGNDRIAAGAIDLTNVTAENPVILKVTGVGGATILPNEEYEFVTSASISGGDASKFRIAGAAGSVVIGDNAIKIVGKNISQFVWTGNGANGDWSNPDNWEGGDVPCADLPVIFDTGDGGLTTMDLTGVTVRSVTFGSNAGSFKTEGESALCVSGGIYNDSSFQQSITAPLALGVAGNDLTIEAASPILIGGNCTVKAGKVIKSGAAELQIDPSVMQATNLLVGAGVFSLGPRFDFALAGTDREGIVTVADGAQFDFKYPEAAGDDNAKRNSLTDHKEFHIAGVGPDGAGALVNRSSGSRWAQFLGNVVLDDDATIGGTQRIDIRSGQETTMSGEGKTLTIKNTDTVTFYNARINLGKIVVVPGARMCFEGYQKNALGNPEYLAVAEGIELQDGTWLTLYNTNLDGAPVRVVENAKVELRAQSYWGTLSSPLEVCAGATASIVQVEGVSAITIAGSVVNNGTITKDSSNSNPLLLEGEYSGAGVIKVNHGTVELNEVFAAVADVGERETLAFPDLLSGSSSTKPEDGGARIVDQLKNIKVVAHATPKAGMYRLCPAGGLTPELAADIKVTVETAEGVPTLRPKPWTAVVKDGYLWVQNGNAGGMMIFVR